MRAWSALVVATVLAAPLRAQVPFEDVLPASTLAALMVDDAGAMVEGALTTATGRLLADEAFAPLRRRVKEQVDLLAAKVVTESGFDPLAAVAMLDDQLAIALLEVRPATETDDELSLALAVLAELDEDALPFRRALDGMMARVAEGSGVALGTRTVRGIDATTLVQPDGDRVEVTYGIVGGVLVMTLVGPTLAEDDHFDQLVGRLGAPSPEAPDSLAEHAGYRGSAAVRLEGGEPGQRIWLDAPAFTRAVMAFDAEPAAIERNAQVMGALGIDQVVGLASRAWFDDGALLSRTRLDVADAVGLFSISAALAGSGDCQTLGLMPPDVTTALAADVDLGAACDAAVQLAFDIEPEAGRELIRALAGIEGVIGYHPRDDLIELLDGQLGVFETGVDPADALPVTTGEATNFALILGITDAQEVTRLIDEQLGARGLHAASSRQDVAGFEMVVVQLPPLRLAYAVTGDLLVASLAPQLVREVLRRKADPDLPSLATAPPFVRSRAQLGAGAAVVGYSRGGVTLKRLLGVARATQTERQTEGFPRVPDTEGTETDELAELFAGLDLPDPDLVDRYAERGEVVVWRVAPTGGMVLEQVLP